MVDRGDVYLIHVELPRTPTGSDEAAERAKLFLILKHYPGMRDVVGVLCNTKNPERALRAFEVEVGVAEGFNHLTVVDCRYPFTFPVASFEGRVPRLRLSSRVMEEVNEALAVGLGMI